MSQVPTEPPRSQLRSLAALWLCAFSFYGLTGPGHTSSWDSALMLFSARNLLDRGDLSVPAHPGTELLRKTGRGGREYVKFAPALIFAHLPMLVVARVANDLPILSSSSGERLAPRTEDEFWVQLTNAWITASLLVVLARFVLVVGGSWREAWLTVLSVGLAGPLWLYAKADGTEALQALALTGSCYSLHRARIRDGVSRHHWIAGVFCAVAILTKTFNALLAPILFVFLFATARSRRLAVAVAFLLPIAGAVVLTGLYNHARFGSPFDSGYDLGVERFSASFTAGALKMLFSPSYGLLFFWPASVLAVLGLRKQWQAERALTGLVVGVFLGLLGLYSSWWAFSGFGWGPRFLIPAVPLLALLTVPVISSRHRWARVLTVACLLSGLGVQALASTTNHWQQVIFGIYREVDCGDYAERCIDDPRVAPLRVAWWRIHGAVVRVWNPGRFDAYVAASPWAATYPWLWPEKVAERQRRNTGFDFWAAPERWRLGRCYLWAPSLETEVPRSASLMALLGVVFAGSLATALRELTPHREASRPASR